MSTKSSPVPKPLVATQAQFVPVPVQTFKNEGGVPQKNSKNFFCLSKSIFWWTARGRTPVSCPPCSVRASLSLLIAQLFIKMPEIRTWWEQSSPLSIYEELRISWALFLAAKAQLNTCTCAVPVRLCVCLSVCLSVVKTEFLPVYTP